MRCLIELHLVELMRFWRDPTMAHSKTLMAGAACSLAHRHLVIPHHREGLIVGDCGLRHHHGHVLLLLLLRSRGILEAVLL